MFKELILKSDELYLDEFTGCFEGALDCMDLLYGADVAINMENIQAVIKFGLIYEVDSLVEVGMTWVKANLSMKTLFKFCKIGLFVRTITISSISPGAADKILNLCRDYILKNSAEALFDVFETWPCDEAVVDFVFEKDLLEVTLPTIMNWICSELHASKVMDKIEQFDLKEHLPLSQVLKLTAKMNTVCETVPNLKRIIELTPILACGTDEGSSKGPPAKRVKRVRYDSVMLLKKMWNKDWRGYDKEKILSLDFRYNSEHFFYAEIVLDWIRFVKPTQGVVSELWSSIRQEKLNYEYVELLGNSITSLVQKYQIPRPGKRHAFHYRFMDRLNSYTDSGKIKAGLVNDPPTKQNLQFPMYSAKCVIQGCELEEGHLMIFRLCQTPAMPCYVLGAEDEDFGGHYHNHKLKHFVASVEQNGTRVLFSFLTNDANEVIDRVSFSKGIHCHCLLEF